MTHPCSHSWLWDTSSTGSLMVTAPPSSPGARWPHCAMPPAGPASAIVAAGLGWLLRAAMSCRPGMHHGPPVCCVVACGPDLAQVPGIPIPFFWNLFNLIQIFSELPKFIAICRILRKIQTKSPLNPWEQNYTMDLITLSFPHYYSK
jgi:hypothetical protein